MAVFKCKMCGGDLEISEGMTVCECDYCGSKQTVPNIDSEKKITLFSRANRLRRACEFDKAAGVYENIVAEFPEEAEAYWGLVLCEYGIEYVDDPKTGKKIPTCHRSSFDSVMDNANYDMVLECSDVVSRTVYREEAKEIERLRTAIIEVSSKEEPYDIFICYKETDFNGDRTIDSVIAQDVYDALIEKGYRVFFSRITLEDKLGEQYEPYIFAALNSAKIMLAFGTDYEYYNAVWVKNEWSRFLSLIEKGEKKTLIPCYKGIDAYDMPKEFARLQAQDMGKIGATQDLLRGIDKIIGTSKAAITPTCVSTGNSSADALTQRGMMAIEDGEPEEAFNYFERALDINPTDSTAYLGKFLVMHGLRSLDELKDKVVDLDNSREFNRAFQFGTVDLIESLRQIRSENSLKIERLRLTDVLKKHLQNEMNYEKALEIERSAVSYEDWKNAAHMYGSIQGIKDADQRYTNSLSMAEKVREETDKERIYKDAAEQFDAAVSEKDYLLVSEKFDSISDWKDAHEKALQSREKANASRKEYENIKASIQQKKAKEAQAQADIEKIQADILTLESELEKQNKKLFKNKSNIEKLNTELAEKRSKLRDTQGIKDQSSHYLRLLEEELQSKYAPLVQEEEKRMAEELWKKYRYIYEFFHKYGYKKNEEVLKKVSIMKQILSILKSKERPNGWSRFNLHATIGLPKDDEVTTFSSLEALVKSRLVECDKRSAVPLYKLRDGVDIDDLLKLIEKLYF